MATRKKKPRRWIAAATGDAPDPRVNPSDPEYGRRRVARLVLIDDAGRAFESLAGGEFAKLPPPPPDDSHEE